MKPFRHFLITHFNAPRSDQKHNADGVPIDRDGNPVRTVEWLDHRFMLFERYCLPSILGQTNQDFLWFIRYDPEAPGDCGGRLERYAAAYTNLRPIPWRTWYATAIEREMRASSPDIECVVTTRIDNDDAYHPEAMADVRRNVRPGTTEFIRFQTGYTYEHASGLAMQRESPLGPFLSFVEHPRREPLRTVSRFSHHDVDRFAPVRHLSGVPRWVQVVHERNLANKLGRAPLEAIALEPEFTIGATGATLMRRLGVPQENPPSTPR
jgi:hypothetical protein